MAIRTKRQPLALSSDELAAVIGAVRRGYSWQSESLEREAAMFRAWSDQNFGPKHEFAPIVRKLLAAAAAAAEKV